MSEEEKYNHLNGDTEPTEEYIESEMSNETGDGERSIPRHTPTNNNRPRERFQKSTPKGESSTQNNESPTGLGSKISEKLNKGSGSENSSIADKAKAARDNVSKAAQAVAHTSRAVGILTAILTNPITWFITAGTAFALLVFAGAQILGGSDYANNCETDGTVSLTAEMPEDQMKRANMIASWLTSTDFKGGVNGKMTKAQAAGMVGNMSQESSVNPTTVQTVSLGNPDYYKTCDNNCVLSWGSVGGKATGIIQWDSGRRVNLVEFAKKQNKQWYDINVQLEYLKSEIEGAESSSYAKSFANCKTAKECTIDFERDVERAGVPNSEKRVAFAEEFAAQFKGGDGSISGLSGGSGSVRTCTGSAAGLDMSDTVKLAISIAYPTSEYNKSNTNGGSGEAQAPEAYKKAKAEAEKNGGKDPMPGLYASCDRFVATVLKATKADTEIPWGSTSEQYAYFKKSPKWKEVKCQDRKPGDVIITTTNGHVMLYAGNVKGQDSLVSASYMGRVGAVGPFTGCSATDWLADSYPNAIAAHTTGFRLVGGNNGK